MNLEENFDDVTMFKEILKFCQMISFTSMPITALFVHLLTDWR